MAYDLVNFLCTKTIIKFVPKLQKKLKLLLKRANKLNLPERSKIIYIIYHLDYPHLSLDYLHCNKVHHSNNNFSIYCKLENYKRYTAKTNNYKFYVYCKNKEYNNKEILKIDGSSPINWIKNKIKLYDSIILKKNSIVPNLINNTFEITKLYNITTLEFDNCKINTNNLKESIKTNSNKIIKPIIVKNINKFLYIKIGSFTMFKKRDGSELTALYDIRRHLYKKIKKIKEHRNNNVIVDIRGNCGGSQEVGYPFIEGIFGKDVETLIIQKKQLTAIDFINNNKETVTEKYKINYNVKNKFSGKLIILMNYSSYSMSIIFIAWLKYIQKKFNIKMIFIGTEIYYQRGLSNKNIIKKYKKYNIKVKCPSRYIITEGFKSTNIRYKPDYYYMNEKNNNNNYPEDNIPIDFINSLI